MVLAPVLATATVALGAAAAALVAAAVAVALGAAAVLVAVAATRQPMQQRLLRHHPELLEEALPEESRLLI
jgi:uncharacterized protein HemX